MEKKLKNKRAAFGYTRKLDSGNVQATFSDPDGQRQSLGTFPTEKAARAALAKVQTDIEHGT